MIGIAYIHEFELVIMCICICEHIIAVLVCIYVFSIISLGGMGLYVEIR